MRIFLEGNPEALFLDERYSEEEVIAFTELGVREDIKCCKKKSDWKGHVVVEKSHGHHERGLDEFDPDCSVEHLEFATHYPNKQRSLFIWKKIALPLKKQIRGTIEKSSRQNYEDSKTEEVLSKGIGSVLCSKAWLPDIDERFYRPNELSLHKLPSEFEQDTGLAIQLRMKGSEFSKDINDFALKRGLKPEEVEKAIEEYKEAKKRKPAFPESLSINTERRSRRAKEKAGEASEKHYEKRKRSIRTSQPAEDKVTYLEQNYTNDEGQLVCQICEKEMPFLGRDGRYYFEAVQLFNDLPKEHASAYVALCPLCAAKFKELVKKDEEQHRRLHHDMVNLDVANSEELRVELELGEKSGSIRFVETHLLDIKGFL